MLRMTSPEEHAPVHTQNQRRHTTPSPVIFTNQGPWNTFLLRIPTQSIRILPTTKFPFWEEQTCKIYQGPHGIFSGTSPPSSGPQGSWQLLVNHWSLEDLGVILIWEFSILFQPLDSSYVLMMMSSDECHAIGLMISQHWFRQWLGAIRHYLSQSWPRSMSPYGITRLQWVVSESSLDWWPSVR